MFWSLTNQIYTHSSDKHWELLTELINTYDIRYTCDLSTHKLGCYLWLVVLRVDSTADYTTVNNQTRCSFCSWISIFSSRLALIGQNCQNWTKNMAAMTTIRLLLHSIAAARLTIAGDSPASVTKFQSACNLQTQIHLTFSAVMSNIKFYNTVHFRSSKYISKSVLLLKWIW